MDSPAHRPGHSVFDRLQQADDHPDPSGGFVRPRCESVRQRDDDRRSWPKQRPRRIPVPCRYPRRRATALATLGSPVAPNGLLRRRRAPACSCCAAQRGRVRPPPPRALGRGGRRLSNRKCRRRSPRRAQDARAKARSQRRWRPVGETVGDTCSRPSPPLSSRLPGSLRRELCASRCRREYLLRPANPTSRHGPRFLHLGALHLVGDRESKPLGVTIAETDGIAVLPVSGRVPRSRHSVTARGTVPSSRPATSEGGLCRASGKLCGGQPSDWSGIQAHGRRFRRRPP
jgi:hypothetical protein